MTGCGGAAGVNATAGAAGGAGGTFITAWFSGGAPATCCVVLRFLFALLQPPASTQANASDGTISFSISVGFITGGASLRDSQRAEVFLGKTAVPSETARLL